MNRQALINLRFKYRKELSITTDKTPGMAAHRNEMKRFIELIDILLEPEE